jgi:predicted metal-binding protein
MPAFAAASEENAMLTEVAPGPAIVACNTCRFSGDVREDPGGLRGGAQLVAELRAVKASDDRYAGVAVQEMPCLFACSEFCAVHLRAPGKVSYVMGRFAPDEAAARAILDYAVHYAQSEHGRVPFRDWPQGVKGHFITRSPPEGFVAE